MGDAIIFFGVLLIPCILFTVIGFVYNKYKDIEINKKLSGFEVAREILDKHKLDNVYIVEVKGNLNDHYDYNHKVLRLSSDVFHGETLTAAIVAARIASYAIQDKENNAYMRFRSTINPFVTFVNYIAYILFIVAICMKDSSMFELANILIMLVFIFHVATLPVEFDACKKSKVELNKNEILTKKELEETDGVFKVFVCTSIVTVITCISTLVSEFMYNIQRRG
jgi:Zn-dependent membrane protease YugP